MAIYRHRPAHANSAVDWGFNSGVTTFSHIQFLLLHDNVLSDFVCETFMYVLFPPYYFCQSQLIIHFTVLFREQVTYAEFHHGRSVTSRLKDSFC